MANRNSKYLIKLASELDNLQLFKESDFIYFLANMNSDKYQNFKYAQVDYDYSKMPKWFSPLEGTKLHKKYIEPTLQKNVEKVQAVGVAGGALGILDAKNAINQLRKKPSKPSDFARIGQQIALKFPKQTEAIQKFFSILARFFPKIPVQVLNKLPVIGLIVTLIFEKDNIWKYVDLIIQGRFKEILNDKQELSRFAQTVLNVIGASLVAIPFPPVQAIGAVLLGISTAIFLGEMALPAINSKLEEMNLQIGDKGLKINEYSEKTLSLNWNAKTIEEWGQLFKKADEDVKGVLAEARSLLEDDPNLKVIDILNMPEFQNIEWIGKPKTKRDLFLKAQFTAGINNAIQIMKSTGVRKKPSTPILDASKINNILWSIVSKSYIQNKPGINQQQLAQMDNKELYREIKNNPSINNQIQSFINQSNYDRITKSYILRKFFEKLRTA